ncbi:Rhodanese-like domain protein [Kalmanozyma brasiliensis GHG001]|uniref:Rhodanese domain-containing protein n=1 Tax=Kalmanozyma brasiliensis (strain GHG001) TaxID=1365824 RepID=V5GS73_KALBG|nr:Rhodanese-like domain protein [Kalmanozyma brasiliensis GHG001]EST08787.1 Rhodanese-like domain protein [Kalmanozyma brasiliensis GHG001]
MSARSLIRAARPLRTLPIALSRTAVGPCPVALARVAPGPLALTHRTFTSTPPARSKDATWQSRGIVKYSELKPETESPSGDITIIDVREPNEVAQGIIPSAVNVPLSQFQTAFSGSGGDFERQFAFRRPEYDDKVVFYCRSGKRSQQALEFAQKNGWWNVRNYEGSWLDWVQQEEARGQASKIKEDDD